MNEHIAQSREVTNTGNYTYEILSVWLVERRKKGERKERREEEYKEGSYMLALWSSGITPNSDITTGCYPECPPHPLNQFFTQISLITQK